MTNHTDLSKTIMQTIKTLPVLSSNAAQIIETINNDQHSLKDLIKITECDATLTSEIIKIVNSPIYSFSSKITSLDKAISLAGEDTVINLVLNSAAKTVFDKPLPGYESQGSELWNHDLKTAIASKKIADYARKKTCSQTAYTGGLLHDIGKSLIAKHLAGTAPKILKALDQGNISSFVEAEKKILGTTHSIVGYEIANYWKLPEPLPSIIKYHHNPSDGPEEYKTQIFCVHLGDIIAMLSGSGTGADSLAYGIDDNYEQYIEMKRDQLLLVMLEVENEFSKIKQAFFNTGEGL